MNMTTDELKEYGSNLILKLKNYISAGNLFSETLRDLEIRLGYMLLSLEKDFNREDLRREVERIGFAINEPCNRPEIVTYDWLESNPVWEIVYGLVTCSLSSHKELQI